jgi:hypothetical protein
MEQARRPALAHHVHRTAPMGPRVLINGIWYTLPKNREIFVLAPGYLRWEQQNSIKYSAKEGELVLLSIANYKTSIQP